MSGKKIKDPIYGYIELEKAIVHDIIDSAGFQRLRNVRQTSYTPLYPASLHNRFVHSIGVYHLGRMAFDALNKSMCYYQDSEKDSILGSLTGLFTEEEWARCRFLFELACLLHDFGHAPFSHTGEEFYEKSKSNVVMCVDEAAYKIRLQQANDEDKAAIQKELDNERRYDYLKHLVQLTDDIVFLLDGTREAPAEHEIMSCIAALETFGNNSTYFKNNIEKSFFARCITGLNYISEEEKRKTDYSEMDDATYHTEKKKMLMDCVIGLLHSSVIDVDRLDYIIRDAKTMGYQSVSVDYQRLLGGIVLVMDSEYCFRSGFHKNAISIIENAVYAHDIEKKWIQGHPAILYDSYLIRQSIEFLENMVSKKEGVVSTLFSYDSLSEKGSHFGDIFIRYLCDTDVLHLMKNVYYEENPYSKEYFNRGIRRHPVWKSEAEYKSLFTVEDRNMLTKAIRIIYDKDGSSSARVNREMIQSIEANIIEEEKGKGSTNRIKKMEKRKKFCEALLTLCESCNAQQDIVLLSTSFFKSNFEKGKVQRLLISFPGNSKTPELKDVSITLSSAPSEGDTLVYIFYYPTKETERIDTLKFTQGLISEFSRIQGER